MTSNIELVEQPPLVNGSLLADYNTRKITRAELSLIEQPASTRTHKPVSHISVVNAVIETLGFRKIGLVADDYAVSPDGMKMFGCMDLQEEFSGCRFSIGLRNANDKSMRLALTIGYRVLVCSNMSFRGDFTPVLAKHSASMNLIDLVSIGVDKMQRNFDPLRKQVDHWQSTPISDNDARLAIYWAFVDGKIKAPAKLLKSVHSLYFNDDRFPEGRIWRLANAFTSALKELDPIHQFPATARVGGFLSTYFGGFQEGV